MNRRMAAYLLAGVLPLAGTGCVVVSSGSWGWSFGSRVWTEPVTGQLAIDTADVKAFEVRTHNGSINFEGQTAAGADASVTYTKKAGGRTMADAEAALAALDVFVEPVGNGTQRIGWRWKGGRKHHWSGCVSFEIAAPGDVRLDAVSHNGAVTVDGARGDVHTVTHNGELDVESAEGKLYAKTHNGRVGVSYAGDDLTLITHNGRVVADLDRCGSITGSITTHNGGVEVVVGPATSANLKCRTHNGSVRCNVPLSDMELSRSRLTGTIGTGDGCLDVTTHNGSVRIKSAG